MIVDFPSLLGSYRFDLSGVPRIVHRVPSFRVYIHFDSRSNETVACNTRTRPLSRYNRTSLLRNEIDTRVLPENRIYLSEYILSMKFIEAGFLVRRGIVSNSWKIFEIESKNRASEKISRFV